MTREGSAESFANVRTSGPSGPTNPRNQRREQSREVNCGSFRVLPLYSRALFCLLSSDVFGSEMHLLMLKHSAR